MAGPVKVQRLLRDLSQHATESGVRYRSPRTRPRQFTISLEDEALMPGTGDGVPNQNLVRWNAAAMVVKANKASDGIGGHISDLSIGCDAVCEVGLQPAFPAVWSFQTRTRFTSGGTRRRASLRAYLEGRFDESNS